MALLPHRSLLLSTALLTLFAGCNSLPEMGGEGVAEFGRAGLWLAHPAVAVPIPMSPVGVAVDLVPAGLRFVVGHVCTMVPHRAR